MKRASLTVPGLLLLCGCHPHYVHRVERTPAGFSLHVSAQCGRQGLQALFERTAGDACRGDYNVTRELPHQGHMWGAIVGECFVVERNAEIECVKDAHP